MYKIVVVHPFQQHSFKTAEAIKKTGFSFKYITSIYNKKNSLTNILIKFLKKDNLDRAKGRKSKKLLESDVVQFCEFLYLFLLFIQRINKNKKIYDLYAQIITKIFNYKVAKYIKKNKIDIIICYDTLSYDLLKYIDKFRLKTIKILDMSAPSMEYMSKIFQNDIIQNPEKTEILFKELKSNQYKKKLNRSRIEINNADYFIVASNFSKISLLYSKVKNEKIFKIPYGSNDMEFIKKNRIHKKLKIIFVGRVTEKKGAHYFFEAIESLDLNIFDVSVIGDYNYNLNYYKKFKDIVEFTGHISKEAIKKEYLKSDILVFPSLADGFGFSVLEAMRCGNVVLCSKNAGVSDIIKNGYNGYLIEAQSSKEILEKLNYLNNNRKEIERIKLEALKPLQNLTWNNYNLNIKNMLKKIKLGK